MPNVRFLVARNPGLVVLSFVKKLMFNTRLRLTWWPGLHLIASPWFTALNDVESHVLYIGVVFVNWTLDGPLMLNVVVVLVPPLTVKASSANVLFVELLARNIVPGPIGQLVTRVVT